MMGAQTLQYSDDDRKEGGFTVVEIIVAMVVMAISVATLVSLLQIVQHTQRDIYYLNKANEAARIKITELQQQEFSSLTNGTINFSSDSSLDGLPSSRTATAVISTPVLAPESKQVDVSITYKVGSLDKNVTITAYINASGKL